MHNAKRTANAIHNNINYNKQQVAALKRNGVDLDLDDAESLFINGNKTNVDLLHKYNKAEGDKSLHALHKEFERMIKYNKRDDLGMVWLYWDKKKMVAWWDEENLHGYIDV
jgi:hypothetical protein